MCRYETISDHLPEWQFCPVLARINQAMVKYSEFYQGNAGRATQTGPSRIFRTEKKKALLKEISISGQ